MLKKCILLMMFLLSACSQGTSTQITTQIKTPVVIKNDGWNPVKVYIANGSTLVRRLGTVESYRSQTFMLSSDIFQNISTKICFVEFAGYDRWCSEDILWNEDSYIKVTAGVQLRYSFLSTVRK